MTEDRFARFSYSISEISRCWHKLAAEEMEKYGLRGTHCVYLLALARSQGGLTGPQLCEACGKDKSDVSRMTRILEEKGLVRKEGGHSNGYGGVLVLTDQGRAAAEHVRRRADRAMALAGRDLTEEQRAAFYRMLDAIVINLRELSQRGIPGK